MRFKKRPIINAAYSVVSAVAALAQRSAELSRKPQLHLMDARAHWALFEGKDGDAPLGGQRVPRGPTGTQAPRVARGEGAHHATSRRKDKDGGRRGMGD